jgi:25S rRNA (uracil2843-N3)-methyltransferase
MTPGKGNTGLQAKTPSHPPKASISPSSSPASPPSAPVPTPTCLIPLELQQRLLNSFQTAFAPLLGAREELAALLQSIKAALFARDFDRAFGRPDWLEAYAARWSAARALAYADVLAAWWPPLAAPPARLVCFGGGAAEVVALAGLLWHHRQRRAESREPPPQPPPAPAPELDVLLIDVAPWGPLADRLHRVLTSPPLRSKYARASTQAAEPLLSDGAVSLSFLQADLLAMSRAQLEAAILGRDPAGQEAAEVAPAVVVMTLLFTLNELYAASAAKTTRFLLDVTAVVAPGSALLVVDSPGSYSEARVGPAADAVGGGKGQLGKRAYPMRWLLDHTLLSRQEEDKPLWEKVAGDESRWFRLDERLRYPIPLENTRYQLHIYRRV